MEGRPRRGMSPLSSCCTLMPGLLASRKARSIVAPAVKPLSASAGTVLGMVQLPPPVPLQPVVAPHWAALRFGLVLPIVHKPVVRTLLRTPAAPNSTPKVSQVLLARTDARPPQLSASVF